jgi:hypothetical protein
MLIYKYIYYKYIYKYTYNSAICLSVYKFFQPSPVFVKNEITFIVIIKVSRLVVLTYVTTASSFSASPVVSEGPSGCPTCWEHGSIGSWFSPLAEVPKDRRSPLSYHWCPRSGCHPSTYPLVFTVPKGAALHTVWFCWLGLFHLPKRSRRTNGLLGLKYLGLDWDHRPWT